MENRTSTHEFQKEYNPTYTNILEINFLKMCLCERQSDRGETFHLPVYFLNDYNSPDWARPEPRARHCASPAWMTKAHVLGPSSAAFPRHISRKLDRSKGLRTQTGVLIWGAEITSAVTPTPSIVIN